MTYVEGFVTPVPVANRDAYLAHARDAVAMIREFGATRFVEAWGDDVPRGKVTDFWGAVQATEDEAVLFSWFEYPDKATRDAASERMMADPRMADMMQAMPFDAKRMIYAGFESIVDEGSTEGGPAYVDGFVVPVADANREAYRAMAVNAAPIFREYGATRVVEAWGDDVPAGEVTDYARATQATDGETVVYSWIEWPDKATRDAAWPKLMEDPRMKPGEMPFDGKRMVWGGFAVILDA